ncbi:kinesin-like protein KIN-14E isoform X4 [Mizuhopecten yessoensis]|uniref:kinesin-like protein KIN-14E isoform X4 n=1 Tax=Mizuhopecten yessoensis TaxID=6573 RepID=UPI000B4592AB|nr:kinesin-like protein KIN-14E isoform X4 [Mizuhopecten yessoensis]
MGNGASADGSPTTVQVKAAPESSRSAPSSDQTSSSKSPSRSKNTSSKAQAKPRQARSEASTPRKGKFEEVEIRKNGAPARPPQRGQGQAGASGVTIKQGKGQEDIVFETFYHRSGKEIQCMYLGNTRYYLDDWGSKEWQLFPKRWYNEGLLITNNVLKDEHQAQASQLAAQQSQGVASGSGAGTSGSGEGGPAQPGTSKSRRSGDDREGVLKHPTKGRIPTYIYQRKHNVHFFYDQDQGQWMRMPIGWELHHEMVGRLVNQVEEMMPTWADRGDILALLRQCNYDIDECISTYLSLEGDPWLKVAKTSKEVKGSQEKDERIIELEKKVKELENELSKEKKERQDAERIVRDQQEKLTDLEVNCKQAEAQLSSMASTRPKSSMRPKTPQVVTTVVKEETVNPEDIEDLNDTAKTVRKAHAQLKMEVNRNFQSLGEMMAQALKHVKMLKSSGQGQVEELEEVRALYRKEAMQRRLLYNQLQELRGNIRVFCRARKDDRVDNCLKFPSDQDIVALHPQQGKKMFTFDRVFGVDSTQEQVFADTKPIVSSCVDGYNVCLMAYGQTGSGKTFTMMGPENNPGINNRAIRELFQVCMDRKETQTYVMKVGLIEIYNETVVDLLSDDAKVIDLKTIGNKVSLPGLIEIEIKTPNDIKSIMKKGDKNRSVASTKMNSTSSRSHLLLLLKVEGQDKVTGSMTKGTLTLCDLAGSERISKTEAEGQRLVEAAAINKSLSALGQVFQALRTSQLHIPYRNSKLTQILQPSLGGDAKACLFVNVSPDMNNSSETVSTLTFGANAKQVALGQAKQNIKKGLGS